MPRKRNRIIVEFVIHAFFWMGTYYALRTLTVSNFNILVSDNGQLSRPQRGDTLFPYNVQVLVFLIVLFYSNSFWLFKKVISLKNKVVSVAIVFGWSSLLYSINFIVIRWLIASHAGDGVAGKAIPLPFHRDLPAPPRGVMSIADWPQIQGTIALIFLSVLGIAVGYFLSKEWIRADLDRSQATAERLSTELRFLREQVNPHFLFNTLNNLFSMAQKKGNAELADAVSKLSGIMRYMIYESNTDSVALQKEIDYLAGCIALNKLRYADAEAMVNFKYPDRIAIDRVQIPPMLFIPFVENAFKHGVCIGESSSIYITINADQHHVVFTCLNTDYSSLKKTGKQNGGIGLENLRRRLALLYPARHQLIVNNEGGKYFVKLQIELSGSVPQFIKDDVLHGDD